MNQKVVAITILIVKAVIALNNALSKNCGPRIFNADSSQHSNRDM
jgi:hypothetical protein